MSLSRDKNKTDLQFLFGFTYYYQKNSNFLILDYTTLLPKYCKTIGICTSSILTNNAFPIVNRRIKTYVFLPFISDTTIKAFPITFRRNTSSETPELLYKYLFDELKKLPIPNKQVSTFLLLFCNNSGDDNLEDGFVYTIREFIKTVEKE